MSATRAALTISVLTIGAKLLGLLREWVLAHNFGASRVIEAYGVSAVDVYAASFRVPDLIFNLLVAGTLSVAFIPVFVRYLQKDRDEANAIAATIFNIVVVAMGVFALAGYFFAPQFVPLIVPGFKQAAQDAVVHLTRILMLSPLLFALSSVATSVLQSHKRFIMPAIAPMLYNLGIIGGAVFFYNRFGLAALAWGAVVGAAMHLIVQVPAAITSGFRPFAVLHLAHPGVKKIGKLFLPRIFGLDLGQISLLISTVVGSFLGAGSIAGIYYGYNLQTVPTGIFAISFAIAAFPTLAEFAGKHDLIRFREFFARTAIQILFVMIPASVLMLLLRAQIVRLILGAGQATKFTFDDTKLVAAIVGFFALSFFAQGLIPLLSRAFYALQNTWIPVLAGLSGAGVNIVLAAWFAPRFGPSSLALAFSIAAVINLLILLLMLHRRLGDLADDFLILRTIKISIASVIMGTLVYATLHIVAPLVNMQTYAGIFIQTAAAVVVAVFSYLGAGMLVELPETRSVMRIVNSWINKLSRIT